LIMPSRRTERRQKQHYGLKGSSLLVVADDECGTDNHCEQLSGPI
jgi:hypothetical protein